ncbi:MAG: hypothetical protein M3Y35_05340, partial [Actinomycetota bacterium]|nr:hypothetical protein [Actinomycetota bacterium]
RDRDGQLRHIGAGQWCARTTRRHQWAVRCCHRHGFIRCRARIKRTGIEHADIDEVAVVGCRAAR